jgi:hypothetical protein
MMCPATAYIFVLTLDNMCLKPWWRKGWFKPPPLCHLGFIVGGLEYEMEYERDAV